MAFDFLHFKCMCTFRFRGNLFKNQVSKTWCPQSPSNRKSLYDTKIWNKFLYFLYLRQNRKRVTLYVTKCNTVFSSLKNSKALPWNIIKFGNHFYHVLLFFFFSLNTNLLHSSDFILVNKFDFFLSFLCAEHLYDCICTQKIINNFE